MKISGMKGSFAWNPIRPTAPIAASEPMLRLNVEAPDTASMLCLRDEVLSLVGGTCASGPGPG